MYHITYAMRYVCYTHAIYRSEGGEEREKREAKDGDENTERAAERGGPRERKGGREKKDEVDRKSSGNEALSFSSGAPPISLTSADLPAYHPACVRACE